MNARSNCQPQDGLTSRDIEQHRALGIDPGVLRAAQVRRVDDDTARQLLALPRRSGDFAGLEYPYLDPESHRRVTLRVRLDAPEIDVDGKPRGKYRQPPTDQRHLYFAPGAAPLLSNTSVPVVFVESEKGALAVASMAERMQRRFLVIATGGCWNWRGRIGKDNGPDGRPVTVNGPLPDFHRITWAPERPAIILFDARPNDSVRAARRDLARFLRSLGARVLHAHLPDDLAQVNGPDDFLGERGDPALLTLFDEAVPNDFQRHVRTREILPNDLDNLRLALVNLRVTLTYDAFTRDVCLNGKVLDDTGLERLWVQIVDRFRFKPNLDTLRRLLLADAHESPVHPVRAYLDQLRWDGTPRLDTWLGNYAGAVLTPYVQAVGALPLVAAVRRVRQPGAQFDELLILEGPQGSGKSSAVRALCLEEDWFSDDLPLGVDSKVVIERTAGKWIVEASELVGHTRSEVEELKSFLSRRTDGPVRLAYARLPTSVDRQFVIIGTTNARSAYLKDTTGARRFWPVTIQQFDVAALARDRDQIWAEAAAREAAGASIRLDPTLWAEAGIHQEARRAEDPWEPILEPLFTGDGITLPVRVPVQEAWNALGLQASAQNNPHAARVNAIATRHGFNAKKKLRIGGKPTWCWVRECAPEDDA